MPAISTLGRLRQEDPECEASLGCIATPCLKKPKNQNPSPTNAT
jgi:hypothetical protein